jgi:hypothetical protein
MGLQAVHRFGQPEQQAGKPLAVSFCKYRSRTVKGIIPEKFVAVRRKLVYKTQFDVRCHLNRGLSRLVEAKAFDSNI